MTRDLVRRAATDTARRIRNGALSAEAGTGSGLARIDEEKPRIKALAWVNADSALAAARAADAAQARGDALGPLHGVPVSIKINVDVAGEPTTDGAVAFKDNLATSDSPLVASLREAGAIIVGRSNAPAFSLRWFTDNALHGRTLNPSNPPFTPGRPHAGSPSAPAPGLGSLPAGNHHRRAGGYRSTTFRRPPEAARGARG